MIRLPASCGWGSLLAAAVVTANALGGCGDRDSGDSSTSALGGAGSSERDGGVGGAGNAAGATHQPAEPLDDDASVIFLHHSTGGVIWDGGVSDWIATYNTDQGTSYSIVDRAFPQDAPYGWENYPYDYFNIWVQHAGPEPYLEEPTLEILTQEYDVIVWKHCFPVSQVGEDTGTADVASSVKSRENYVAQYQALREKMWEFSSTRFIVWTGAALVESATNPDQAERARAFFEWVTQEWDQPGDNIFVWDFRQLETGGGLYLLPENAASADDSHPNGTFAAATAPRFGQRIVDVIEGRGDTGSLTGE